MDEFPVISTTANEILKEEEFEKLYSAPTGIVVLLSLFYGTISGLAVVGNAFVIWVVVTTRQMRTVTNMYIANLAFADVVIGLFCIPFQFQAALLQRWNLPWFMCGFCPFVQALTVNVSVFTLTAIAIDRHRAIINPLRARPTKLMSKLILIGIWFVAFIFATPCAIAFRVEVQYERYRENDTIFNVTRPFCMNKNLTEQQLQTYRYMLVFMQYFVPFCVISFVYIQMAVKLWGTHAPGNAQSTRDITLMRNKKKEKFKREFNKRFAFCFCKTHTLLDATERTFSMHTRVSSIRSSSGPNSSIRIRNNNFNNSTCGVVSCGEAIAMKAVCITNTIPNANSTQNTNNQYNAVTTTNSSSRFKNAKVNLSSMAFNSQKQSRLSNKNNNSNKTQPNSITDD
ncbi:RYamide receptor-like isoform X2 [Eurosta solidaginis]|uniref:RYamide receptor-like isoform X2 n=1 Tax=Eurosta solidaginis TaxID=178769 RepID=UPI0035317A75